MILKEKKKKTEKDPFRGLKRILYDTNVTNNSRYSSSSAAAHLKIT